MAPVISDPNLTVHESADWEIYVDGYGPGYGSSAAFVEDDLGDASQAEPGDDHVVPPASPALPWCFIDGRRRVELPLWAEHEVTGERFPGLAGAYAVGAVVISPGRAPRYAGERIGRLAIWGGGRHGDLVSKRTRHRWTSESTTVSDPAKLLARLQDRMRLAEGNLALDAAARGWTVVLDGPLNRIRSLHHLVTGYVKSHASTILPEADHRRIPSLPLGGRTRVYAAGTDRYTCYLRVGTPRFGQSPWSGIARLDFPAASGLDAVVERADRLAFHLPRYAGVAHRDPRAPVNLTPVSSLEAHLSRLLGPPEFATRGAREAVRDGVVR